MRTISCAAALLLMAAAPVHAADKPLLPAPGKTAPSGPHDWTGFYAGVDAGYVGSDSQWSTAAPGATPRSFGAGTPTFGTHAGYNYQLGSGVVLGTESDLSHAR
jgi:opacity protein-like surface antigen